MSELKDWLLEVFLARFFPFKRRRARECFGRGVVRDSPLMSGCHPRFL